jgi:CBS domain containing-hemolysin-like protein
MSIEIALLIAVAVLFGNAFFVGAEFALVSARRSNIELKALGGSRAAKLTLSAMEQVSLMLAGAQLGVTLCSLIFGAVGEPLIAHVFEGPLHTLGISEAYLHPIAFIFALIIMVYLHVVIGEMVPKNISLANSTRAALILVPPLLFSVRIAKPLVTLLNAAANACIRLLGVKPQQEIRSSFSRDEVAGFVKESHREGLLSTEEESLLSGTIDFEERTIQHIILPLEKLIVTSARPTQAEVEQLASAHGFSRYPVRGRNGLFKGYVHVKDILQQPAGSLDAPLPAHLRRQLGSVKANASLREALATMQQTGSHIAQVVNTRGTVIGIVMLEDLLEELVGTIRDDTQNNQSGQSVK